MVVKWRQWRLNVKEVGVEAVDVGGLKLEEGKEGGRQGRRGRGRSWRKRAREAVCDEKVGEETGAGVRSGRAPGAKGWEERRRLGLHDIMPCKTAGGRRTVLMELAECRDVLGRCQVWNFGLAASARG